VEPRGLPGGDRSTSIPEALRARADGRVEDAPPPFPAPRNVLVQRTVEHLADMAHRVSAIRQLEPEALGFQQLVRIAARRRTP